MVKSGYYERTTGLDLGGIRVVTTGLPRSGTTFVWQTLCHVFGSGVVKTHDFLDVPVEVPVIMSLRDPRDAAASHWRVGYPVGQRANRPISPQMTKEDVVFYASLYQRWFWVCQRYRERPGTVEVTMRELVDKPEVFFDRLSAQLGFELPGWWRAMILEKHGFAANKEVGDAQADGWSPTGVCVGHADRAADGIWREVTDDTTGLLLCTLVNNIVVELGYDP